MNPESIIQLVQIYGYPLMFILMYFEGPIATFVSSFLASLGFFNIFIVWLLSFLGDFTSDLVHFYIGNKGEKILTKKLKKEGFTYKLVSKLKARLHNSLFKSLFLIKLSPPPISSGGLFLTGSLKNKRVRAIAYSAIISLIIESFFIFSGFFIGSYFQKSLGYFNKIYLGIMVIALAVVLFFIIRQAYIIAFRKVAE